MPEQSAKPKWRINFLRFHSIKGNRYQVLAVCGGLLLAVGLVFGHTVRCGFVSFDDGAYVYANPHVLHGLSPHEIVWAWTRLHAGYWIPLCWISYMVDSQVFGLAAGGYHLSNVLWHAATVVLLFLVLRQMTGRLWPSAMAAALFAIHPLRVESVAWVTERKDVLSGFFFMLTLGAYDRYVRGPSRGRYAAVVILFVLGLLAKPMLVTLPLVLLLLDFWPLGRFAESACSAAPPPDGDGGESLGGRSSPRLVLRPRLIVEKIPLFVVAAALCLLTAATEGKTAGGRHTLGFPWRLGNALVSYVAYLGQFLCPVNLAVFYPHPETSLPIWKVVAAMVVLAGISAAALASWRRCPYLLVGWLWYVVTLLPVIGLLQVGGQAMADRFTYATQIGVYIALAWAAADALRWRGWLCGSLAALVLAAFMGCAWRQVTFWWDAETMWNHALACTERNHVAYLNLGRLFAEQKKFDEAANCYRKSLECNPRFLHAYDALGVAALARGRYAEAIGYYQQALKIKPDCADAYDNIGRILAGRGQADEAIGYYRQAIRFNPDFPDPYDDIGRILAGRGRADEAIGYYQQALKVDPDFALAHNDLGAILAGRGRIEEAIAHYQESLRLSPDSPEPYCNLGAALAQQGKIGAAMDCYRQALKVNADYAPAHLNLGNVFARQGQFEEAIIHYRKALQIDPQYVPARNHLGLALLKQGQTAAAMDQFREVLRFKPDDPEAHYQLGIGLTDRYEAGKPDHEPPPAAPAPKR
jgi:tetratricopeptide (TPR) repeat protein